MIMVKCPNNLHYINCPACDGAGYIRVVEGPDGDAIAAGFKCPSAAWSDQAQADIDVIKNS